MAALLKQRLSEITPENLKELTVFSFGRLTKCGLPTHLAEDLPQMAIACLLQEGEQLHWHPRLVDLRSPENFVYYLRGVINSHLANLCVKRRKDPVMVELDDEIPDQQISPAQQAEQHDLQNQLFARLRLEMAPRHQPTIAAWELEAERAIRIPSVNGHRKYIGEVRQKAQETAIKLEMVGFTKPTKHNIAFLSLQDYVADGEFVI